ncbi:hypothetical protein [Halomarina oriensis]|uniref:DUF8156 domain-containing protein n=1 Tax=Halomarina oriensis TaxID=671145 RepID=A0A6B0GSR7_9EURY|nr:hypothetical protein [Halomarina oriensis]
MTPENDDPTERTSDGTDAVRAVEDRWTPYRRALRRDDQYVFDRLFEYGEGHAAAIERLTHRSPVVPLFAAVDLEQEKRLDTLEARLDALEDDLNRTDGDGRP